MPRKSVADLAVAQPRVDGRPARLVAPAALSAAARRIWDGIIRACPPEHFRPSDEPLLRSFCEATALADQAASELAAAGPVVGGRTSPWLVVMEKSHRAQAALALRLRLCPSARIDPKSVGRQQIANNPQIDWEDEK